MKTSSTHLKLTSDFNRIHQSKRVHVISKQIQVIYIYIYITQISDDQTRYSEVQTSDFHKVQLV